MGGILSKPAALQKPEKRSREEDKEQPTQNWSKRVKTAPPPGVSKNQWKKQQKAQYWESRKEEVRQFRKEKKKASKQRKREQIQQRLENGESLDEIKKSMSLSNRSSKDKNNPDQKYSGVNVVFDCGFDDKMNEKERHSLSKQIARSYSENRRAAYYLNTTVSSFKDELKKSFDFKCGGYENWNNVHFAEEEFETLVSSGKIDLAKTVYLTADESEEKVDELQEGYTYIIGGIVDKNRYKNLCYNKAKEMKIKTARLPIDEYVSVSGRKVFTSLHVYLILLKWMEVRNWKEAFERVLPERKNVEGKNENYDDEEEEGKVEKKEKKDNNKIDSNQ